MVRDILVNEEKVRSDKVTIIPYAQTTERFEGVTPAVVSRTRSELGMNDQLSLVCVSRLFHGKGHRFLFEALAPMIRGGLRVRLYLVGSGDYRGELQLLAERLGISNHVEFLGWRDDTLAIIGAADLIVHPSLEDALSQALIESLMLARPIVATDISGASDTLRNGEYGRLVRPADADAFRQGLEETINEMDEARRRAAQGRAYILDYMGARKVADQYKIVYEKIMQDSGLRR
jgi:glycosyltransferase involved in cell wall biosynthesis